MKDTVSKKQNSARYKPFTIWREARIGETKSERILPYLLDNVSALNKKLSKADNNIKNAELSIKGNDNDSQIVGKYNSASYEYFRSSFFEYLNDCNHGRSICDNKEESGLVVQTTITLFNQNSSSVYYTINFYHTTNAILVNRTGAKKDNIDMFMKLYDTIMSQMPIKETYELNNIIRAACQDAIQGIQGDNLNVDDCRSPTGYMSRQDATHFPALGVDHCENNRHNLSAQQSEIVRKVCQDAIRELKKDSNSLSVDHCRRIPDQSRSNQNVKRNKRTALECSDDQAHNKKQCYDEAGCSHWSMDVAENDEVQNSCHSASSLLTQSSKIPMEDKEYQITHIPQMTTIEAMQRQLLNALDRINSLEKKVRDLSSDNHNLRKELKGIQLYKDINIPPPQDSPDNSYADIARRNIHRSTPKSTTHKRRHDVAFLPKKNIVVIVEKEGDIIVNDDDIRKSIGSLDTDITIEKIFRSATNCYKKFCIQFSDERMVDTVLTKWTTNIFGKSTARRTIQPSSAPPTLVGVVKGVPFSIEDEDLCADLEAGGFGKTTVKRIRKGNKPTRAVKVYFQNHELLTKAINERVRSQNLTFTVDRFNHLDVIRCYNCHRYKHTASACPNDKACVNCGGSYHGDNCQEIPRCVNCKGNHRASSITCPVYVKLLDTIRSRSVHTNESSSSNSH